MSRSKTPEEILLSEESRAELSEAEQALHRLLVPENQRKAIRLDEFAGLYADEVIAADRAYVAERIRRFNDENAPEDTMHHMRGELFEAIVNSQIEESDWMGADADVIVTSRYDDIKNGVDGIVEFEREGGGSAHLALAVDVTDSEKKMAEKFERVKESIRSGSLSEIKYFKSKNFRGELSGVPRVVVGAGRETIRNIAELLLRFRRLRNTVAASHGRKGEGPTAADEHAARELAQVRREVAVHPLQGMLLGEVRAQLESFGAFARAAGNDAAADRYGEVLALIDAVLAENGGETAVRGEAVKDPIHEMILRKAAHFGENPRGGVS